MSMRETMIKLLKNPKQRKDGKEHVSLQKIFTTTQNIKSIQRDLVAGHTFDKQKMEELVQAMFGFINGIVSPDTSIPAEVNVEEIVE